MVEKNKTYIIEITGTGEKGEGVGRYNGFAVFVPYALAGETVEVLIVKVLKNYAFGKIRKIITPSHYRRTPECSVFYQCGGCDYQHCSYEYELKCKTQKVKDCISRIGGLDITVENTIGYKNLHYRNKSQFPVTTDGIGFYAPRSHRVVPVENCLIQNEKSNRVIGIVKSFMTDFHVKPYDELTEKGMIRHIFTRCSAVGQVMVCIVTASEDLKNSDVLVSMLKNEFGENISVIQNINPKNTNVVLGSKNIVLYGNGVITDKIGDLFFEISPQSFFQINPGQTKILYDKIVELGNFNGTERVLDLYCGIGTISLYIAGHVGSVVGVECVPQAIENAKRNALLNGVKNAEFYTGNAEDMADKFPDSNVIVIDPPRKGCDAKLLETINNISPEKVIYVSCNPATFARDLKILNSYGYNADKVYPVDMFPRTSHVETVVLLSQLKPDEVVKVELSSEDLELTSTEAKATYEEIKTFVKKVFGFKVSSLYIAQVKRKHGLEVGQNYNISKKGTRVPVCPKEKEDAIVEALRYFKMLK